MVLAGQKILIADDEPKIRRVLEDILSKEGFTVVSAVDGEQALTRFAQENPDLLIVDLMMPKLDGFEVVQRIRSMSPVPIIVLSVKDDELDRVMGFRFGADDYVTKPFSPKELVLRVQAILRRSQETVKTDSKERLQFGSLIIDKGEQRVEKDGHPVYLTAGELSLLFTLAEHAGQALSRDQLAGAAWGSNYLGDPETITVMIRRIREKIEDDPSTPCWIETVWGVGYRFNKNGHRT